MKKERLRKKSKQKLKKKSSRAVQKILKIAERKKVQQEQPVEEKKLEEEIRGAKHISPSVSISLEACKRAKMEERFSKFLNMFKKLEIKHTFC